MMSLSARDIALGAKGDSLMRRLEKEQRFGVAACATARAIAT